MSSPLINKMNNSLSPHEHAHLICPKHNSIPFLSYSLHESTNKLQITTICTAGAYHKATKYYPDDNIQIFQQRTHPSKHSKETPVNSQPEHTHISANDITDNDSHINNHPFLTVHSTCSIHLNNPKHIYCCECNENICCDCLSQSHSSHWTQNVSNLFHKNQINPYILKINSYESEYFDMLQKEKYQLLKLLQFEDYEAHQRYEANIANIEKEYSQFVDVNRNLFRVINDNIALFIKYEHTFDYNLYCNFKNILEHTNFSKIESMGKMVGLSREYVDKNMILHIKSMSTQGKHRKYQHWRIVPNNLSDNNELKTVNRAWSICNWNCTHYAVGFSYGDIKIIDYYAKEIIHTWRGHTSVPGAMHVHRKTNFLISLGFDRMIFIWNYLTGEQIQRLNGHSEALKSVVEFDNGNIATTGNDSRIVFWDMVTFRSCVIIDNAHRDWIQSMILLKNGKLLTADINGGVRVWRDSPENAKDYETLLVVKGKIFKVIQLQDETLVIRGGNSLSFYDPIGFVCLNVIDLSCPGYWLKELPNGFIGTEFEKKEMFLVKGKDASFVDGEVLKVGKAEVKSMAVFTRDLVLLWTDDSNVYVMVIK